MSNVDDDMRSKREAFQRFVNESLPALEEFLSDLGAVSPRDVRTRPETFVDFVSEWCATQDTTSEEDRIFLTARIAYFLGEILKTSTDGRWSLCEHASHETFGRYVIASAAGTHLDVVAAAHRFVTTPPPRSLARTVSELRRLAAN